MKDFKLEESRVKAVKFRAQGVRVFRVALKGTLGVPY